MKSIIILGSTGYIGSKLYLHLKSLNHKVDTVDLEWFGNFVDSDNIKKDYNDLPTSFYKQYDVIILLAGHSSVPMCLNNRMSCFNNNVRNFVNLLEKITPDQRFIYISSSSVYGQTSEYAVTENWHNYTPTNYYDLSKKEIDLYASLSDLDYYGLRLGTVSGASPNLRTDIMINKMFHSAKQRGIIEIVNPEIYRPILGIKDLCGAIVAIIDGQRNPGIYNLTSLNVMVVEIAKVVSEVLQVPVIDKGKIPSYDFSISTDKFEKTYNFEFKENIKTIVESLVLEYDKCHLTERLEAREYV